MAMDDAASVDARGMRCPWPALRAARAMRGAARVVILADDPVAPGELAALAREQGWGFERLPDGDAPTFVLAQKNCPISVT